MAKKYIKIFDDTILKQTINQGTEDQRATETLGAFSMGELAYTRDSGRVFVGDCGNNNDKAQTTIGGSLVGNKYLGIIDSAPLPYDAYGNDEAASKYIKNDNTYTPIPEEYVDNNNGLLEENSRYRLTGENWSNWDRKAEYNKKYNAYNGDFMYDVSQNALILFDTNIRLSDDNDAEPHVTFKTSDNEDFLQLYNNKHELISSINGNKFQLNGGITEKDVKFRTPILNYNNGSSDGNPAIYKNGFVVFRNVEPDGDTIIFAKRGFNKHGAAVGENQASNSPQDTNYSHNLLTINKVPAPALASALDRNTFVCTDNSVWKLKSSAFNAFIDNTGTFNFEGATTIKFTSDVIFDMGDGKKLAFKGELNENGDIHPNRELVTTYENGVYSVYAAAGLTTNYFIKLGDGLISSAGANKIRLGSNATIEETAPKINIDPAAMGTITSLTDGPFIGWNNTNDTTKNYNVIFDIVADRSYNNEDGVTLYTLNKAIIESGGNALGSWIKGNKVTPDESKYQAFDRFGVIGNNNAIIMNQNRIDKTPYLIGFDGIEAGMDSIYPVGSAGRYSIGFTNPIRYTTENVTEAMRIIGSALTSSGSERLMQNGINVTPIFKYTYTVKEENGKTYTRYSLNEYFDDPSELEGSGYENPGDNDTEYIFPKYNNGFLVLTYVNKDGSETTVDIDIFEKGAEKFESTTADTENEKFKRGIYVTKKVLNSTSGSRYIVADVYITPELIINDFDNTNNTVLKNLKVSWQYHDEDSNTWVKTETIYSFTENYVFTPALRLPKIISDTIDNETYYSLEGSDETIEYYQTIKGDTKTDYTPGAIFGNSAFNGSAAPPDVNAVIIYTSQGNAYVYYIKTTNILQATDKPKKHEGNIYIKLNSAYTKISSLDETVTSKKYKFNSSISSIIIEINKTVGDALTIFSSPNVYLLNHWGSNAFTTYNSSAAANIISTSNIYTEGQTEYYTYVPPVIKSNSSGGHMPITSGSASKIEGSEHLVETFAAGKATSIVEVPLQYDPCLKANCIAFRIVGLTNTTELTMRVIGYR